MTSQQPHLPRAGLATDGYRKDGRATATCYCGSVQLDFPLDPPGYVMSFICHCTDCHKISASAFASNFVIEDSHLKHNRGQSNLTKFSQNQTIVGGETMSNFFCKTCGTLMYRQGSAFPGRSICRIGTIDDFNLMETKIKPTIEQYRKDKICWVGEMKGLDGLDKVEGSKFTQPKGAL